VSVKINHLPALWEKNPNNQGYFMKIGADTVIMTADRPYKVGEIVSAEARVRRIPAFGKYHEYEILHLSDPGGEHPQFFLEAASTASKSTKKGLGAQYHAKVDASEAAWSAVWYGSGNGVQTNFHLAIVPNGKNLWVEGWYVTGSGKSSSYRKTPAQLREDERPAPPPRFLTLEEAAALAEAGEH
jgi:hypothetical protein